MAAPQFVPTDPADKPRTYQSPDHVPEGWVPDRPGDFVGRQPQGDRLGYQGPDQGYGLVLARHLEPKLKLQRGEHAEDAVRGLLGIALRRASMYGRAPVIHDFTVAATIWGFLADEPPAELVELRRKAFANVANVTHHYAEAREIADSVPEATLRMTHQAVAAGFPARWRELLGR